MLSGGEFDGALPLWCHLACMISMSFVRLFPFHDNGLLYREGSQEASQKTACNRRTIQGVSRDSHAMRAHGESLIEDRILIEIRRIQHVL